MKFYKNVHLEPTITVPTKYLANCSLHKKQAPITLLESWIFPQDASFPKLTEKQHSTTMV